MLELRTLKSRQATPKLVAKSPGPPGPSSRVSTVLRGVQDVYYKESFGGLGI